MPTWHGHLLSPTLTRNFSGLSFARLCEAFSWTDDALSQLHQWVLSHEELGLPPPLSSVLCNRCLATFSASKGSPSQLQREVISTLSEVGVQVEQEFVNKDGYSIDARMLGNRH